MIKVAPIRVLVVDDSGFMRTALKVLLETDPEIQVVGEARDGREAVEAVRTLRPNVVTMDLEMPVMNGIEATEAIAAEHGSTVSIIMVSSHTQTGAAATLQALTKGAVDFVSKSSSFIQLDLGQMDTVLLPKIHYWARRGFTVRPAPKPDETRHVGVVATEPAADRPLDLVLIGVSTGGPATLPKLLRSMGPLSCPVVVAQHMPELFTAPFAENLRGELGLDVVEGEFNVPLRPGSVVILPGGCDAMIRPLAQERGRFYLRKGDAGGNIHPSVDLLFKSAAVSATNPVGVILTGMGSDGTEGARELVRRGAPVLIQTPQSATVPGMPEAAIEAGLASDILSPEDIGRRIARWNTKRENLEAHQ